MVYNKLQLSFASIFKKIGQLNNCAFCELSILNHNASICDTCTDALKIKHSQCVKCGSRLNSALNIFESNSNVPCGFCQRTTPIFNHLSVALDYKFPINRAISSMKFSNRLDLLKAMTHLLEEKISSNYKELKLPFPKQLIPIPLHPRRLAERGFNQSQLIANQLSKKFDIPVITQSLIRVTNTPHQIGLKANERRKNLKGCFIIEQPLAKHIALIDDVYTTGSTLREATKQCIQSGSTKIDIWCLAKT